MPLQRGFILHVRQYVSGGMRQCADVAASTRLGRCAPADGRASGEESEAVSTEC